MLLGATPLSVGNLKILQALDFEDETPGDAIPSQLSGRAAAVMRCARPATAACPSGGFDRIRHSCEPPPVLAIYGNVGMKQAYVDKRYATALSQNLTPI